MKVIESLKVFLWRIINYPKIHKEYLSTEDYRKEIQILNSSDTIHHIIHNKLSISRYGDGEFQMMDHYLKKGTVENFEVDTFQNYNQDLAARLLDVYTSNSSNHFICIPYALKDASVSKLGTRIFWEREWNGRKEMLKNLNLNRTFGDTNFTRFYMDRVDITDYKLYIELLKKIWHNRDIIFVEGEYSRLGVNNDLFSNAKSIKRILCPATNAFDRYEDIINSFDTISKDDLILIALGHTATVLAYDLSKLGFQALDIGHIDVEYEWYKMSATKKVKIPNKYVNEVKEGRSSEALVNEEYKNQIIKQLI